MSKNWIDIFNEHLLCLKVFKEYGSILVIWNLIILLINIRKGYTLRYNMKYVYSHKTEEKMETGIHKQLRTKKF